MCDMKDPEMSSQKNISDDHILTVYLSAEENNQKNRAYSLAEKIYEVTGFWYIDLIETLRDRLMIDEKLDRWRTTDADLIIECCGQAYPSFTKYLITLPIAKGTSVTRERMMNRWLKDRRHDEKRLNEKHIKDGCADCQGCPRIGYCSGLYLPSFEPMPLPYRKGIDNEVRHTVSELFPKQKDHTL